MTGLILVTGGTGTLGRPLVQHLVAAGSAVRVLSRRPAPAGQDTAGRWATADLKTGRGLDAAVAGAEVIAHCATGRGDVAAARNLIAAAKRAGRPHLVYISIVGVDQLPVGYYKSKLDVERQVAGAGLPWTVLRATQFHQLIVRGCEVLARLPVMLVPAGTSFQPVDAAEVAVRLAELTSGPAAGRVPDIGGPEVLGAADLARAYLRARGRSRPVLPIRLPGAAFAGFRSGANLAPGHRAGRVTFAQFLAGRFGGEAEAIAAGTPGQPEGSD